MADPKIAVCAILHPTPENRRYTASVMVAFKAEDGTVDDEVHEIFEYYDDELTFWAEEFIGLTKREATDLFMKKDIAYIQS